MNNKRSYINFLDKNEFKYTIEDGKIHAQKFTDYKIAKELIKVYQSI